MRAAVIGILSIAAPLAVAQTSTWTAETAHSEVDFMVHRLEVTTVRGRFGRITGELSYNDADVTKSTVTMTIDTAGLSSRDDVRDEHLRSDAFFEVTKFPTATFVSTSVARKDNGLTLSGNLTLHGITKPVTLQVRATMSPKIGTDKKLHAKYLATTTLSREAFAIGDAYPDVAISDAVNLTIHLDLVKK